MTPWSQQIESLQTFVAGHPAGFVEESPAALNRRKILDSLRHHGNTLIGAVIIDTGLSYSTVLTYLTELREDGLVSRVGTKPYVWSAK